MKKTLYLILLVAACISLLAACGSDSTATTSEKEPVNIEIGYVTTANEKDPYHVAADYFKQLVEEKTDGRVTVTLFPNGQLGQEREMIEGIQLGTVDGGVITNAYLSGFQPKLQLFDLPFLFKNAEEAHMIADGEVGQALLKSLEDKDMKGLAFAEGGFRNMMNSKRAIRTLADANGIKFRAMENPLYLEMFKALGAEPVPLAWGEVYTANQLGTVDGLECPIPVYDQSKLYEVTKYVSLTRHTYSPLVLAISMNKWNEIPSDLQPLVEEAAQEAAQKQRKNNAENLTALIKELEDRGIKVNELENPAEFKEAVTHIYEEFSDEIGKDLVEKALELLN
jgi:tripartite ATP-independent transporter DctP family solute receptor